MTDDPDIHIHREYFEKLCRNLREKSFQEMFERLMKSVDECSIPIKEQGRIGDQGCDGYSPLTGRFYRVYAPPTPNEKKARRKVARDSKL